MAVPVLAWAESNGAGPTVSIITVGIVFAAADTASALSLFSSDPVQQGTRSFEKWWRAKLTTVATNAVGSFTVSFASTAPTDAAGASASLGLFFGVNNSYTTPTASASLAATIPTSSNTTPPGVGLNAPANTANAFSGYITLQEVVAANAAGTNTIFPNPWMTIGYQYS